MGFFVVVFGVWVFFFKYHVNADPVCSAIASSLQLLPPFFPSSASHALLLGPVTTETADALGQGFTHRLQHDEAQTFAGDQNCAKVEAEVMAGGLNGHQQLPTAQNKILQLSRAGARRVALPWSLPAPGWAQPTCVRGGLKMLCATPVAVLACSQL